MTHLLFTLCSGRPSLCAARLVTTKHGPNSDHGRGWAPFVSNARVILIEEPLDAGGNE